jgi:CheY-like chemotaxis protein
MRTAVPARASGQNIISRVQANGKLYDYLHRMISKNLHIVLADDDQGDRLLFKEALDELPLSTRLTTVNDGEQLIEAVTTKGEPLPDVIFLDLNMPRKNGFATLGRIKRNPQLQNLPVVIFSTAFDAEEIDQVYRDAAHYYIHKPADFQQLKQVMYEALTLITLADSPMPLKQNFIITGKSVIIPGKE